MKTIDLNCDLGEGFGRYQAGADEQLMRLVSSVNIACGFHAGDPATMRKSVAMALREGVAIGAHPGLPDLQGFGRREMKISPDEAYELTVYQIGALAAFVKAEGGQLHHVKPHGALYNMAAVQYPLAEAIAEAVRRVDESLMLYGLSGSFLLEAGRKAGLRTVSEVFADRTYQSDGTLTPRQHKHALIEDDEQSVRQVMEMVTTGSVTSTEGSKVLIEAQTVCLHSDGPNAVHFAARLRGALEEAGVSVQPPNHPE